MGKVAARLLLALLGAVSSDSEDDDAPAQRRSTGTMHTADNRARNPTACLRIPVVVEKIKLMLTT